MEDFDLDFNIDELIEDNELNNYCLHDDINKVTTENSENNLDKDNFNDEEYEKEINDNFNSQNGIDDSLEKVENKVIIKNSKKSKELTIKQWKAIKMFCQGETKKDIAIDLDVSRKTIQTWFRQENFSKELEIYQKDREVAIRQNLHAYLPTAVSKLKSIIENEDESTSNVLKAIETVFKATNFFENKNDETNKIGQTVININPNFANKLNINYETPKEKIIDEIIIEPKIIEK